MPKEATLYCLGILKGIYAFDKDSRTQYKELAVDAPGEYFAFILEDWRTLYKGKTPMVSIKDFLESNCPDWVCAVQRRRFPVGESPTRQIRSSRKQSEQLWR